MRAHYPVNEWFLSMQGEAAFTGTPALFVRLQGCPVGCGWCDTKYTWDSTEKARLTDMRNIRAKLAPDSRFAWMTDADIIGLVPEGVRHVVITGGEPALYNLNDITSHVVASRRRPQVETSGTHELLCHPETWVTVSPKIGMEGGFSVRRDVLLRADEIKYPVGKERDVQTFIANVLPHLTGDCLIYLQPLSQSKRATNICLAAASQHGWRVSLQVHKFVGLP